MAEQSTEPSPFHTITDQHSNQLSVPMMKNSRIQPKYMLIKHISAF